MRVASCELRVASCELRVASCELRVASCELRVASCELRVASCESQAASCQLPVASCQLLVASGELPVTMENSVDFLISILQIVICTLGKVSYPFCFIFELNLFLVSFRDFFLPFVVPPGLFFPPPPFLFFETFRVNACT